MGLVKEFKEFAMRGNVVDLAVGVIIGGAFGKIVTSVIDDLLMPLIGFVVGNVDFSNLYLGLSPEVRAAMAANENLSLEEARKLGAVFAWGHFATIVIDFLIVAFCIFLVIKGMNAMKKKQEEAPAAPAAPPAPSKEELLLTEIRDELRKRNG